MITITELFESQPHSVRLVFFVSFFALFAFLEWYFPRRRLTISKTKRWANNLALTLLNTLLLRLVFPVSATGFALLCQKWQIGFFNLYSVPLAFSLLLSMVILDLVIWYQHRLFHAIPLLWRLHQVHHADLNLDLSSAARFHSLEMLLSMLIKFAAIALLGAPALAVVMFEIVLSSLAMFNHSNISLPLKLDKSLRLLIVTPDMHRIHHSVLLKESNKNFGFCLSIWDRLFACYCQEPKEGQLKMSLGLNSLKSEKQAQHLGSLLFLPFKRQNRKKSTRLQGDDKDEKGDSHLP